MEDVDAIAVIRQLESERRLSVPDWPCLVATYSRADTPSGFRAQMQQPQHCPPRSPFASASAGALEDLTLNPPYFRAIICENGGLKGTSIQGAKNLLASWRAPQSENKPRSRPSDLAG